MPIRRKTRFILAATVFTLALGGIGGAMLVKPWATPHGAIAAEGGAPAAPQAMPVTVEIAKSAPVHVSRRYSGRLEAVDFVEIRPQVGGRITDIKFEDGQNVKAGEVLYVIDPRPYQAAHDQAAAEVTRAKSVLELAEKEYKRAQDLIKTSAISQRILDEKSNDFQAATAALDAAHAQAEIARINLEYAYVKAPINGRVSRAELTRGNIVEAGSNAPVLTTIVATDGIYADFDMDEQTYLTYFRGTGPAQAEPAAGDDTAAAAHAGIPVRLSLRGGGAAYDGAIHSFDNRINTATGTIRARALLPNDAGDLLPGMFATVMLDSPSAENRITVPERAVGTDQDRKFVYVVDDGGSVAYREVQLGDKMGERRIVTAGLNEGERVIIEGIIRLRPGMPVAPHAAGEQPAGPQGAAADTAQTTAADGVADEAGSEGAADGETGGAAQEE